MARRPPNRRAFCTARWHRVHRACWSRATHWSSRLNRHPEQAPLPREWRTQGPRSKDRARLQRPIL